MDHHVIRMEQSPSTKFERANAGETSRGHDQENGQEISNVRKERNEEYGADQTSPVTYLKSILHNDAVRKKNMPQKVSCPKVPPMLRNKKRSKDNYDPRIVSLGPYHHGKTELQAAQMIKTMLMEQIISKHGKSIEDLYLEVFKLNEETRSCYNVDTKEDYDDKAFALMMLQDGCFILYFIESVTSENMDYIQMIIDHLGHFVLKYLFQDIILLENQIPFRVLKVLMNDIYIEKNEGLAMVKSFLNMMHWGNFRKEDTGDKNEEPFHLLGLLKSQISKRGDHKETKLDNKDIDISNFLPSFGSVSDLKAKGINFKPSNSILNVDFRSGFFSGELKLPPLFLDSNSQVYYTNLMAFEECTCTDFTVTSYIKFMNSIIASPEDVKALRSKRIILHSLNSDKEVFKMLKEISIINSSHDWFIYQGVRQDIEKHYNNKIKIWIAEARYKYFSQPWSVVSLLAAAFVIILTFLQTFYTINPRKA